ncbi:MAG: type II toxin-antitoxin system RelE/ParE family toxin [Candidatus Aenigmarchaeota archaeon]|nr:type II toxin-antitoxin system RelE/ParE family toxin [Candidatus Aenigmarchaeota archaeon]
MFMVELSRRAKKELDLLNDKRIGEILESLKLDPVPVKFYDVKKLEGIKDSFRIRVGKIRILYTIVWQNKIILVSRIEKRGTAYD